jgi:hypothetical protein
VEGQAPQASPVAEAPVVAPAAPASEPTDNPALRPGTQRALSLEEVLRRGPSLSAASSPVSKEAGADQPAKDANAKDGESAAGAASKPSESDAAPGEGEKPTAETSPTGPSRRGEGREANLARIAELEAEVTQLRADTPADPEADRQAAIEAAVAQARQTWEDEQARKAADKASGAEREAILAREQRYRALRDKPLSTLNAEDYQFVEEERERRERYPDVQRHFETVLEAERAGMFDAASQQLQRDRDAFWADVRADLATVTTLPGVEVDAVKAAKTFHDRDALVHAAGAAWKEAEIRAELQPKLDALTAKLEKAEAENRDLKLTGPRGLGAARAPLNGGRSSSGEAPAIFDPSRPARDNLRAAVARSSS